MQTHHLLQLVLEKGSNYDKLVLDYTEQWEIQMPPVRQDMPTFHEHLVWSLV